MSYRRVVAPVLVYRHDNLPRKRAIEVWTTSCIVTHFSQHVVSSGRRKNHENRPHGHNTAAAAAAAVLINPGNPGLTGVQDFSYFPKGGPVPAQKPTKLLHPIMGAVSQWGGMPVGPLGEFVYPLSSVDGMVHELGGFPLRWECTLQQMYSLFRYYWIRQTTAPSSSLSNHHDTESSRSRDACPVGNAIRTSAAGALHAHYSSIVHTTPPFYHFHNGNAELELQNCYQSALELGFQSHDKQRRSVVAVPLLGAGTRGFPRDTAIHIAASSTITWCNKSNIGHSDAKENNHEEQVVAFGLLDRRDAQTLADEIQTLTKNHNNLQ